MWCAISTTLIPMLGCFIIHMLILAYARSSSRRVHTRVFSVEGDVTGTRRRESRLLRQALILYCTFVAGCSPIILLNAIDGKRLVNSSIYSMLYVVSSLSFFIIVNSLILTNHEVKAYFKLKIPIWLRRSTQILFLESQDLYS
jgi:hypothetical protein